MMFTISRILVLLLLTSCASTTRIRATNKNNEIDKSVKIYVDSKYEGDGEVVYSDKKTVYSAVPFFEMKKEACQSVKEKLDTETSILQAIGGGLLAGVGVGIMGLGADEKIKPGTALVLGLPISLTGILTLIWTRKYTPTQSHEFQCVKVE